MPDQKLLELCTLISSETDPKKLAALLSELHHLLTEQEATIKANIARRVDALTRKPQTK